MSDRRRPRTDWTEGKPPPRGHRLTPEWYARILILCAICSVISATAVVISGSFGHVVVQNEKRSKQTQTDVKKAVAAVPKAKAAAAKVAKAEAVKTRRVVLRRTRTIVRHEVVRQVGRRGAPGRAPTFRELDAAVARHCARVVCALPVTPGQVRSALAECVSTGGCGALRGPAGADGKNAPPVSTSDLRDALEALCAGSCKVTQEQVDMAVAMVCAQGGCPAPAGPQGMPGPPGGQVPCAQQDPAFGYQCVVAPPP